MRKAGSRFGRVALSTGAEAVCHWLRQCFVLVPCHPVAEMCLAGSYSSRSIVAQNSLTYIASLKQPASKQIRELLEANNSELVRQLTIQERPGKFCFRFWQEGPGFGRNIVGTSLPRHCSIDIWELGMFRYMKVQAQNTGIVSGTQIQCSMPVPADSFRSWPRPTPMASTFQNPKTTPKFCSAPQ